MENSKNSKKMENLKNFKKKWKIQKYKKNGKIQKYKKIEKQKKVPLMKTWQTGIMVAKKKISAKKVKTW